MKKKRFSEVLPSRKLNSHKGDFGHVFVLAGSIGLTGAAYLTSQAAILSGSGLVTLGIPESLNSIMEIKLTEVITRPLPETENFTLSLKALAQIKKVLSEVDVLAIGPGLSGNSQTKKLVERILTTVDKPIVLDADGINALIGKLEILDDIKAELVITPHPGEMSRLLNLKVEDIQKNRAGIAREVAKRYNIVVALKGYRTVVVAQSGKTYINNTGNPGMASAGCGDVLTGIIASFLGQGMDCFKAARLGAYIHGLAGDIAAKKKGQFSLIASDILDKLPQAFNKVK